MEHRDNALGAERAGARAERIARELAAARRYLAGPRPSESDQVLDAVADRLLDKVRSLPAALAQPGDGSPAPAREAPPVVCIARRERLRAVAR